jgi:hypothetical protein
MPAKKRSSKKGEIFKDRCSAKQWLDASRPPKKRAPIRVCACGRKKENRGPKERRLMSAVGAVVFRRRYWKCICGADGSYAADELLGVAGKRYTKTVQKHCQHLSQCSERIFGEGTSAARAAYEHSRGLLVRQGWAGVCQWVSELLDVAEDLERERRRRATDRLVAYFSNHTNRLNYAERLQAGRAIGSGQVEGEAKTLGLRLKRRGARWNKRNVQPMAAWSASATPASGKPTGP